MDISIFPTRACPLLFPLSFCVQVLGRNFILFGLVLQEPRLQEQPVVFYLFLVWGTVELVRYPYYALQSAGRDITMVTWLRYTAWICLLYTSDAADD